MSVVTEPARQKVLYGEEIKVGMTVLERCGGRYCDLGTHHETGQEHELRIERLRWSTRVVRDRRWWQLRDRPWQLTRQRIRMTAVTVDESGSQIPWECAPLSAVRVRA